MANVVNDFYKAITDAWSSYAAALESFFPPAL